MRGWELRVGLGVEVEVRGWGEVRDRMRGEGERKCRLCKARGSEGGDAHPSLSRSSSTTCTALPSRRRSHAMRSARSRGRSSRTQPGAVAKWWSSTRRPPASSSRLRVRTAEPATASSEGGGAGGGEDGGTGVGVGAGDGGGGGGAEGSGEGGGEGGDGKGGHPGNGIITGFAAAFYTPDSMQPYNTVA